MRSEISKLGGVGRSGLGEGLKPSRVGIQGVCQMLRFECEEIDQQAPFSTTFLHFKIPFQSQEALEGALDWKKELRWRYFDLREFTQRRF